MRAWIFQSNPAEFRLNQPLSIFWTSASKTVTWSIRQARYIGTIDRDNEVFIWRALGDGLDEPGIIAYGFVSKLDGEYEPEEEGYWFYGNPAPNCYKVKVKLTEKPRLTLEEFMLPEYLILQCEKLRGMNIFGYREQAIFPLSDEEFEILLNGWNRARIITGHYRSSP